MQNIGIITKRSDIRALEATTQLAVWLRQHGCQVTVDADIYTPVASRMEQEKLPQNRDLIVVIGGDGTFLAASRAMVHLNVPLLGINMGRLGFLTEVTREEMLTTMADILAGNYQTEERVLLAVSVERQGEKALDHLVLNDVVVHKGALARMMEFKVAIDGQFVFSSRADGLIIATPTGSTAYALSAGGPIIHPALDAILLVPICPHTLTNRPIVVPGAGTVTITLAKDNLNRLLTLDGQTGFQLSDGDQILIRQSEHKLRVVHQPQRSYYSVLRQKLLWGEKVGNEL